MTITKKTAAQLCGISERQLGRHIDDGTIIEIGDQIDLASLPLEAQKAFAIGNPSGDFDFAALSETEKIQILQDLDIVLKMSQVPAGTTKVAWIGQLSEKIGQSPATLYRWQRQYRQTGSLAVFLRQKRSDKGTSKVFCQDAIDWLIMEYLQTKSKHQAYRKTQETANINNWQIGDYSTACRILKQRCDQDQALMKYAHGGLRALDTQVVATILRDPSDLDPLEIICGDHHQFDLFVVVPELDNKIIRPWLTAWQDLKTRAVVGWNHNLQPNSWTISLALRHAILPKVDKNMPIYGKPGTAYIDNGKDYRSWHLVGENWQRSKIGPIDYNQDTTGVLNELGIKQIFSLPYNAKAKPIERWFETIEYQLIENMPGFCGHTVNDKPGAKLRQEIAEMKLLTWAEFIALVDDYIVNRYHTANHRGKGMDGSSPIQVWQNSLKQGFNPVAINNKVLLNALLVKEKRPRTVDRHGVRWGGDNNFYYHPVLINYIGQRVTIRFDPSNTDHIWLYTDSGFLCEAERFQYASFKDTHVDTGARIAQRRHQIKKVREKYLTLTGGIDVPDNTKGEGFTIQNTPYQDAANQKRKKAIKQHSENFEEVYPWLPTQN